MCDHLMDDESRDIPLTEIVEPRLVLRLVNRNSLAYMELKDSIEERGFLNSVCVRPLPTGKYEIVDGLYRYNVARELGRRTLPCIIKHGLTDDDVLALQIQANAVRPETTDPEYARQIKKIMSHKPDVTMAQLSVLLHKSPTWIRNTLSLLDLAAVDQKAVDRGEMPLESAYMLAKIPGQFRPQFRDQAKQLTAKAFKPIASAFIKQFREAVRQGKLERLYTGEFSPVAYLRPLKEVQAEYNRQDEGPLLIAAANCRTPLEAWCLALQWVLHLDHASVEQQRQAALRRQHQQLTQEAPYEVTD